MSKRSFSFSSLGRRYARRLTIYDQFTDLGWVGQETVGSYIHRGIRGSDGRFHGDIPTPTRSGMLCTLIYCMSKHMREHGLLRFGACWRQITYSSSPYDESFSYCVRLK